MSASLDDAESQWLSQLATMRAAIAELNLSKIDPGAVQYGKDLSLDDGDILHIQGNSDLWDIISEISDEDYTSEESGPASAEPTKSEETQEKYDQAWLSRQCIAVSSRNSGLDAYSLQEQIEAILASDGNSKLGQGLELLQTNTVQTRSCR